MHTLRKLLVVARVVHYRFEGKFWSYTPYAREIDVWADLFSEVAIAGTLRHEPPPGDCSPFAKSNVAVLPVTEAGGDGWKAKCKQIALLPQILWQLHGYLRNADAVHARCPCDLGLLGILMGPLYSSRLIAKYATQWLPYNGEPRSWAIQRTILRSFWWRGPVTVYGKWPQQPEKVIPFFTSMLTDEQVTRARNVVRGKRPDCLRILFVGRLSKSKNVDVLLRSAALLKSSGLNFECVVVGEGPELSSLEHLTVMLGIQVNVRFTGGLSFDDVIGYYEQSDVLVLASEIEGWPKAIAEGMAFGLVCIGTARGMVPQMLGEGRGLLVEPRDVQGLHEALFWVAQNPDKAESMRKNAAEWAQKYSIDGLREALRELMGKSWHLSKAERDLVIEPKEFLSK